MEVALQSALLVVELVEGDDWMMWCLTYVGVGSDCCYTVSDQTF